LTEFAVFVCLCMFLPDDDLVEVETYTRDVTVHFFYEIVYNMLSMFYNTPSVLIPEVFNDRLDYRKFSVSLHKRFDNSSLKRPMC
jgi:hypothetical protein